MLKQFSLVRKTSTLYDPRYIGVITRLSNEFFRTYTVMWLFPEKYEGDYLTHQLTDIIL